MTLVLTLTPEKERRLQEQARRAGLSVDDYALQLLDQIAGPTLPAATSTPAQKAADFLAWSKSQNTDVPPLPSEATTREALYADDELAAMEDKRAA